MADLSRRTGARAPGSVPPARAPHAIARRRPALYDDASLSDETISLPGEEAPSAGSETASIALTIAWSLPQPERVGEVARFVEGRGKRYLGRGELDDKSVVFQRVRPGEVSVGRPLEGPAISRRQLALHARAGTLFVERLGKCPLSVNGEPVEKSAVVPGDTLLLKGQLLLVCHLRAETPALSCFAIEHARAFAMADVLGLVGESPVAWRLRERIAFAAAARGHVLVWGQTGSGKEIAARGIHRLSARAEQRFVARNAATLPTELVDAELFGNMKGYPNPNLPERTGLIGQATGGVLFLDEIGDLVEGAQAHLLRCLDRDGEYQRLGESVMRRADVRLIAATNRPLSALRDDLLQRFRLRVALPALDERREDVPLILLHLAREAGHESPGLLARFRDEHGRVRIDALLVEHALRLPLHGNVRELEAILWASIESSAGDRLELTDAVRKTAGAEVEVAVVCELGDDEIRAALRRHDGNLTRAASALGLPSRFSLYRLLKRRGLQLELLRE
jgi:two-component system, NtrC family, response regulator HydG